MLAALRRWLFPPTPGVAAHREAARMLAAARRVLARAEATVMIRRERGENTAEAMRELRVIRGKVDAMERRFDRLQSLAVAAGAKAIDVKRWTPEELRDDAEREMELDTATQEVERCLRP